MSKKKENGFNFRACFMSQVVLLKTIKQFEELALMAIAYMNGEPYETDDKLVKLAFSCWEPYLDKDKELSEMRSLAGKKGAKARWNKQESEVYNEQIHK